MVEAPDTAEGWYILHDMRTVDWDDWESAGRGKKKSAVSDGEEFLEDLEGDGDEGDQAVYSVVGDKADLMFIYLRETLEELNAIERQFESTALAEFTTRTDSHVSVTELGGYTNEEIASDELEESTRKFVESRLYPSIPDTNFVSFYPMNKKREKGQNWYSLPKEEREEMMKSHGMIGRQYAGEVTQTISGSVGIDDWEWGVDLFGDDMIPIKHLVYEMRFDEASAKYADFGPFYTGIRFPASDLDAFMSGDEVPTTDIRAELEERGIYSGEPHGEDVFAMVVYSDADADDLHDEVEEIRSGIDADGHISTDVYTTEAENAVVSLWESRQGAEEVYEELGEIEGARKAGEGSGFSTMGMFYKVEPEYKEEFEGMFADAGELLEDMDGHRETHLLENVEDENDMFITSRWDSKDAAMGFFRSDDFKDTVDAGREILADRPRHVFLA
ncbi:heme-binding protein [Halorutilales archaeon Cl-col2-1]